MSENDVVNTVVTGGVGLLVAFIFAIVGVQAATQASFDSTLALDNQSELEEGTLTNLVVETVNGEDQVVLNGTATTGSYASATYSNTVDRHVFYVDITDSDNSSLSVSTGGNTYELEDGRNVVELDSTVTSDYSFTVDFSRDADTVESPEFKRYEAQEQTSSLLPLLASGGFAILLLGAVLIGFSRYM